MKYWMKNVLNPTSYSFLMEQGTKVPYWFPPSALTPDVRQPNWPAWPKWPANLWEEPSIQNAYEDAFSAFGLENDFDMPD